MTETPSSDELQRRIDKALEYAPNAVFDGAHHKLKGTKFDSTSAI